MKKFLFTFSASGGVVIEAATEEEAKAKYDAMESSELYAEIDGLEDTGMFEI
jgi:hypothetical protein